jgi:hypothetical protein
MNYEAQIYENNLSKFLAYVGTAFVKIPCGSLREQGVKPHLLSEVLRGEFRWLAL